MYQVAVEAFGYKGKKACLALDHRPTIEKCSSTLMVPALDPPNRSCAARGYNGQGLDRAGILSRRMEEA